MKFQLQDYKQIIPSKYCISQEHLNCFLEAIEQGFSNKRTGRPRSNDEPIIAGIFYVLETGCPWEALPLCFGPSKTVYHRFREFCKQGIFQLVWKKFLHMYNNKNGLQLEHQIIDCNHRKSPLGGEKTGHSPVDRRKLGSKIALCVETNGIPIGLVLAKGNKHDTQIFEQTLKNLQQQISQSHNHYMHADKGFDSERNRTIAVSYKPIITRRRYKNSTQIEKIRDGCRWVVERTFSWLSRFRRIFVRYDKLCNTYLAFIQFAFQVIIFKKLEFSD